MSGQRSVKLTLGSDERVFGSYRELEDYAAQLTEIFGRLFELLP